MRDDTDGSWNAPKNNLLEELKRIIKVENNKMQSNAIVLANTYISSSTPKLAMIAGEYKKRKDRINVLNEVYAKLAKLETK